MNGTARQNDLYGFIEDYAAKHGICPSYDEMANALNLKSKSGIHRMILGLESRGLIRRMAYRARAIEILPQDGKYATLDELEKWRRWGWTIDEVIKYLGGS